MTPDPDRVDPDRAAAVLGGIALEAGRFLAAVRDRADGHCLKEDGSPSTAADLEAERLVLARLRAAFPAVPVVAEESAAGCAAPPRLFFLVDPLDGTRDYLTGEGEYSVNIALVSDGRPIAAALAVPALDRVWRAGTRCEAAPIPADGPCTAWREVRCRPSAAGTPPVALVSRRHGDDRTERCLDRLGPVRRRTASSAAKFGLIASGEADLYVRCGPTMEWDTAAGDHLVTAAGGTVLGPDRRPLRYGRPEDGFRNGPFAAFGCAVLANRCVLPG